MSFSVEVDGVTVILSRLALNPRVPLHTYVRVTESRIFLIIIFKRKAIPS